MNHEAFITTARSYVGVPHVHRGRDRNGVDCVGLLVLASRAAGFPAVDCEAYSQAPDGVTLLARLRENGLNEVPSPRPGAVGVFWIRKNRLPQHVAIFASHAGVSALTMIHSYAGSHFVVEHRFDKRWAERLCCVLDFPEGN